MGIPVDNESVQQHFRLVHKIARKLLPMVRDSSIAYDDLFSEGCIGLIKALESYDPASGNAFSTFAYPTIAGYIRTYIDRRCQTIRYPAHIVLLARRIHKAGDEALTASEVMETHGCTYDAAELALEFVNSGFVSIDKPVEDEKGNKNRDLGFLANKSEDTSQLFVDEFLEELPPKVRTTLQFTLKGYSRNEIAVELGVSRTRVWHYLEDAKQLYQRYKMKGDGVMAGKTMTKEKYLELRMQGKNRKEIAKTLDQTQTYFENYWLKKWNIKDPLQEEIALELFQKRTPPNVVDDALPPASVNEAKLHVEVNELRIDRDGAYEKIRQLEADLEAFRESGGIIEALLDTQHTDSGVNLRIPLLDTGEQDIEDRLQSLVTIGDLKGKINLREFNLPRLMLETFNRLQVIIGIIQAQAADIVEPADLQRTVQQFAARYNKSHIKALRAIAEENGWKLSEVTE